MVFHQGRVTISRTCNLVDLVGPEWRAGTSFTLAPLAMVRLEKWKDPCRSLSQCHPSARIGADRVTCVATFVTQDDNSCRRYGNVGTGVDLTVLG